MTRRLTADVDAASVGISSRGDDRWGIGHAARQQAPPFADALRPLCFIGIQGEIDRFKKTRAETPLAEEGRRDHRVVLDAMKG
jgi:hypothetical protein